MGLLKRQEEFLSATKGSTGARSRSKGNGCETLPGERSRRAQKSLRRGGPGIPHRAHGERAGRARYQDH